MTYSSKSLFRLLVGLAMLFTAQDALAQWRPWNDLPPHCSHIIVLRGEEDRRLAEDITFGSEGRLLAPGPHALEATRQALLRMTPFLCQSIRRIAFGTATGHPSVTGAVNSFGSGDLVLINLAYERFWEESLADKESSRLMLQGTLLHEAAHAAETLLGAVSADGGPSADGRRYAGSWSHGAREHARRVVANARLDNGLYKEWQRLHRSFVRLDWAERYDNDGYQKIIDAIRGHSGPDSRLTNASAAQVSKAGFMTPYGAKNWAEDFATFVELTYTGKLFAAGLANVGASEDLRQDYACRALQTQSGDGARSLASRHAAVYTKLMFLLDLELVHKQDVDWCIGAHAGLRDVDGAGFHFFEDGQFKRSFKNGVKAGMGSSGIGNLFEMTGQGHASFGGKNYPASMKLSLGVGTGSIERISWPRGVYELEMIGADKLSLRLDGAQAGNFDASDGYVLVASSTGKRISGAVFLTKAWRPNAPIPVPQVFDPPLHIRFEMEK